jgi:polysaccharide biosynthesis protein PslH
MDFRPNEDAVLWFAAEIWPLIRIERPDTQFFIVGRSPGPHVEALSAVPGITVTGAVDDPRPYVARATVYVVPMRMGGGVRLKVLQAMAMERAVVATPVGAEGVTAGNGTDLLIAASPQAFAQATLALLSDPTRRAAMGRAAREKVKATYDWSVILPTLDRVYP